MDDFQDIFRFGIDYTDRMVDVLQMPLWIDVLNRLKVLLKCFSSYDISVVYFTPIWYNDILRMYLKHEWYTKGTSVVADLLDEYCTFLSLEEFQDKYSTDI